MGSGDVLVEDIVNVVMELVMLIQEVVVVVAAAVGEMGQGKKYQETVKETVLKSQV